MNRHFLHTIMLSAAVALLASSPAMAQPYPNKPIRVIVPFPPGAIMDTLARRLGAKLSQRLGEPVVIDNRGGANGQIGMEIVARAPADGYTIILAGAGVLAVNPHLYRLPYDILNDFAPIINVASLPGALVVHPSVPVKTVKELITLGRQNPDKLTYGSAGVGGFGHVSGELFAAMAKIRMTHVPYKGSAPALTDLIGGHIQVLFNNVASTIPHVKSGRVRALAITGATRLDILPDLPTVAEAGVPGYENTSWSAFVGPARTPQPIIERLNREFAAILQTPDEKELARAEGSIINGGTPEQFRDYLKAELAKFGKLVKEMGIKTDAGN